MERCSSYTYDNDNRVTSVTAAGTTTYTYTYDAWGNPTSITGSMSTTLGTVNPLRYRGYVYDTETGLYYLQSRYHNPKIGRFINADVYTSTGQGFTGNNTFVYCGNSPVLLVDSSGTLHEISAGAVGSFDPDDYANHRAKQFYGAATPYIPDASSSKNCGGYVLDVHKKVNIGTRGGSGVFAKLRHALHIYLVARQYGKNVRLLSACDSPINDNEYRIAYRFNDYDFHFMVQHNDGRWSHKRGSYCSEILATCNPSVISWDLVDYDWNMYVMSGVRVETNRIENYYDSETLFFAVSNVEG